MTMRVVAMLGTLVSGLAMVAMATPAEAQRWHGGRHHDHDHISGGDLLLGALLGGAVVAIAASDNHNERERVETIDRDAPPPNSVPPETPAPDSARFDGMYDEEAAADRCSVQAEIFGSHYAHVAHVTRVSETVWDGGSWLVKGRLELADSYRDTARRTRDFRCTLRRGTEPDVEFAS